MRQTLQVVVPRPIRKFAGAERKREEVSEVSVQSDLLTAEREAWSQPWLRQENSQSSQVLLGCLG